MNLRLSVIAMMLASANVFGQSAEDRACGTELLKQQIAAKIPGIESAFRQTLEENVSYAKALANEPRSAQKTTSSNTIPVVFHIVLTSLQQTALGGIDGIEERIDSQLAVINRDFNKENADSTKIPAAFKSLYGNVGIRFARALRKPDGTASKGYEIITTTAQGIEQSGAIGSGMGFADGKYTNGVPNAWDPSRYLNIWVFKLLDNGQASNILGLTMPPSFLNYGIPGLTRDELGIVLNYGAFGVKSPRVTFFTNGITAGRTLTHELGHYFEVWHVWGDDNGKCVGSGGKDDGISDTPPQASATYGCPTFPLYDACTTTGNGIMFMNFMDYVNDVCMHMFTNEQAMVMKSQIATGRESHSLTQNPEIMEAPTGIASTSIAAESIRIFPNPTTGMATIQTAAKVNAIQVTDITGNMIQSHSMNNANGIYDIDLSGKAKGMYLVRCATEQGDVVKKLVLQ